MDENISKVEERGIYADEPMLTMLCEFETEHDCLDAYEQLANDIINEESE